MTSTNRKEELTNAVLKMIIVAGLFLAGFAWNSFAQSLY